MAGPWEGLALRLECPEPVLDVALEQVAETLSRHRLRLLQTADLTALALSLLPSHFDISQVTPALDELGIPRFQRPHLRFQLDQGRIRDLLMGTQRYGRPEYALRELYQNALDACRYRRAREQYLRATDPNFGPVPIYSGRIVILCNSDAAGRRYVECSDDGVGMDMAHLHNIFARAGRRFADTHEYSAERARWDQKKIKFHANSRFGVGVFSYFMLADDIEVETRRLRPDGSPGVEAVRAHLIGGGTLFRAIRSEQGRRHGTSIRLYLNREASECPSGYLLETIRGWLWVPEFETQLWRDGMLVDTLLPNQLSNTARDRLSNFTPIMISGGLPGEF